MYQFGIFECNTDLDIVCLYVYQEVGGEKGGKMLFHVWSRLSKIWVIFSIPAWDRMPFVQALVEARIKTVLLNG